MRVLLHTCCGPCAIMPLRLLQGEGHGVTGLFFNPNVQPLAEYMRRREGAAQVSAAAGVPLLFSSPETEYDLAAWCRAALAHPEGRCAHCVISRMGYAAERAKAEGFEAFTTSLLYSRYQDHDGIRKAAEDAAARWGVAFLYRDFRGAWQEGIAASKELGIYRQQYCGCVFSEEERYAKEFAKIQND